MAATGSQFSKAQRQVDAVKTCCQLLEVTAASKALGGKGNWQEARQAAERALDAAAGHAKLAGSLQRLCALLAELPSEQGKRAKQGNKGGAVKKQKV